MIFKVKLDSVSKTLSLFDIMLNSNDEIDKNLPYLGEIVDFIAVEKPDYEIIYDYKLRNMRVRQVMTQIY